MYCTQCGKDVQEGATFCTACGAQVGAVASATPSPPPSQPVSTQPAAAAQPPAVPAPPPAPRRTGFAFAATVGVVVVLAGAGIGAGYWVWSSPPSIDADSVESFVLGETASAEDSNAEGGTDEDTENANTPPVSNPVNWENPEGGYAVFLQSLYGRRWNLVYDYAVPEAREWIANREAEASGTEGPLMEPTEASMSEDGVVTAVFHNLENELDYRYVLSPDPAGEQAGFVIVEETIGDGDPERTRVQMVERDGVWLFAQHLGPVE